MFSQSGQALAVLPFPAGDQGKCNGITKRLPVGEGKLDKHYIRMPMVDFLNTIGKFYIFHHFDQFKGCISLFNI